MQCSGIIQMITTDFDLCFDFTLSSTSVRYTLVKRDMVDRYDEFTGPVQ